MIEHDSNSISIIISLILGWFARMLLGIGLFKSFLTGNLHVLKIRFLLIHSGQRSWALERAIYRDIARWAHRLNISIAWYLHIWIRHFIFSSYALRLPCHHLSSASLLNIMLLNEFLLILYRTLRLPHNKLLLALGILLHINLTLRSIKNLLNLPSLLHLLLRNSISLKILVLLLQILTIIALD